jgi:predicted kinase
MSPAITSGARLADALGLCDLATYRSVDSVREPAQTGLPRLVLIRGLPGSGKTSLARELTHFGYRHFEADQYFEVGGYYRFDPARVPEAHRWCQRSTREALAAGRRVVVANTFTRIAELAPYWPMAADIEVLEALGTWPNVHGVPSDRLKAMSDRWEKFQCPPQPAGTRIAQRTARNGSLGGGRYLQGDEAPCLMGTRALAKPIGGAAAGPAQADLRPGNSQAQFIRR